MTGVGFMLVPVDDDVRIIERDATLPDLVYDADTSTYYGAIPVCNTGEEWLRNAKLVVGGKGFKERAFDLPHRAHEFLQGTLRFQASYTPARFDTRRFIDSSSFRHLEQR